MTDPTHLDGNALGGLFLDLFGGEMTDRRGCCDGCGAVNPLGAMLLYRGPGDVLRCPACGAAVMVVVSLAEGYRVNLTAMRWVEL